MRKKKSLVWTSLVHGIVIPFYSHSYSHIPNTPLYCNQQDMFLGKKKKERIRKQKKRQGHGKREGKKMSVLYHGSDSEYADCTNQSIARTCIGCYCYT